MSRAVQRLVGTMSSLFVAVLETQRTPSYLMALRPIDKVAIPSYLLSSSLGCYAHFTPERNPS